MDTLQSFAALVATADSGSFAGAGRQLGESRVQIARSVAALEAKLGARLFDRSTRSVKLTQAGHIALAAGRRLIATYRDTRHALGHETGPLSGHLRVVAPRSIGQSHIASLIGEFMAENPGIFIDLAFRDDHLCEPRHLSGDVSLYAAAGEPARDDTGRAMCILQSKVLASPEYVARHGRPRSPGDLAGRAVLHLGDRINRPMWPLRTGTGTSPTPVNPVMWSNSNQALMAACLAGRGIALLPGHVAETAVSRGQLVSLLDGFEPIPMVLCAAYDTSGPNLAAAAGLVAWLERQFRQRPPGGAG